MIVDSKRVVLKAFGEKVVLVLKPIFGVRIKVIKGLIEPSKKERSYICGQYRAFGIGDLVVFDRKILISVESIAVTARKDKMYFQFLRVLAHEIGHYYYHKSTSFYNSFLSMQEEELAAEAFAKYMLIYDTIDESMDDAYHYNTVRRLLNPVTKKTYQRVRRKLEKIVKKDQVEKIRQVLQFWLKASNIL